MKKGLPALFYLFLFLFVFLADRITKFLAVTSKVNNYKVNSFLSFDLVFNRGISWGMFDYKDSTVFLVIGLLIAAITVGLFFYAVMRFKSGYLIIGETLAVAGSVSNIFDRIFYGGVIDFIVLSFGKWSWPVFNIADFFIVIGVFILSLSVWTKE